MESNNKVIKRFGLVCSIVVTAFVATVCFRVNQFAKIDAAIPLTAEQVNKFQEAVNSKFPETMKILKSLPYELGETSCNVFAESAILIDVSNGCVLYEKNANEVIPPASMTKLFAMYVVDEEVTAGRLSYNQLIPLPPQSWACNMPPHSSLMFLGEGQRVTLEELLLGLSICSGNDAAYALAYTICGNMEDFVARMNKIAADLGLVNTHFEESSGYSENNTTTAYEMAQFCRIYLQRHPDSLQRYHGVKDFTYPKEKNLAPGDKLQEQDFTKGFPAHITMPIYQKNTNPLLGKLEGCDGLKTGYIDESGYNLALTASRNGTRFLSVTMKGPGNSAAEGQAGRIHDGTELMEWAFSNFFDEEISSECKNLTARIYGAKERAVNLIPVYDDFVTVPFISGETLFDCRKKVHFSYRLCEEKYFSGNIEAGQILGEILVLVDDLQIAEIQLVSDRSVAKANFIISLCDMLIKKQIIVK